MIRKGEAVTAPRLESSDHSPSLDPCAGPSSSPSPSPDPCAGLSSSPSHQLGSISWGSSCQAGLSPIHQPGSVSPLRLQLPGRTQLQPQPSVWIYVQDPAPAPAWIQQPGLQLPGRIQPRSISQGSSCQAGLISSPWDLSCGSSHLEPPLIPQKPGKCLFYHLLNKVAGKGFSETLRDVLSKALQLFQPLTINPISSSGHRSSTAKVVVQAKAGNHGVV